MFRRAALTGAMAVAASCLVATTGAAQLQPCTSNCATLTVTGGNVALGGIVTVGLSFTQGPPDNSQPDNGNDKTAALAFTLGIPGDVPGAPPLSLPDGDCNNIDPTTNLPPSITVDPAIAANFKVVVENLQCTTLTGAPRNHCLCPDPANQDQTQDKYINIVVYGPKDLPASGPVTIPVLPPSGGLMTIALKANQPGATNLHVFAQTDNPPSHPQFGAFLSIGDKSAVDQTAKANVSQVQVVNGTVNVPGGCTGDCDSNSMVTVDELVKGVNISLGKAALSTCTAFNKNGDAMVTVDELVIGVNNAINGCSQ
jgi:hypothetical protein